MVLNEQPHLLIQALSETGYCLIPDFLTPELTERLRAEAEALEAAGLLREAGVGRGAASQDPQDERKDSTLWWEETRATPAQAQVIARWNQLKELCNRKLFLGLWEIEAHWAVYPRGGYYKKHLDRFRDDDSRTLSAVLYLNPPDWKPEDGGELRLWPGLDPGLEPLDITPSGGSLVVFLSDRIPHEVRITRRKRYSVAAWFRRR